MLPTTLAAELQLWDFNKGVCHVVLLLLIITIISVALHLTDKGVHTELYKIYKNVIIKPQK